MSTLYLHIGLVKTGSTFLQNEIFPLIKSLTFIHNPKSNLLDTPYPWRGAFTTFFDHSPHIWEELGNQLFEEIFGDRDRNSGDVLVSDETICVNMRNPRSWLGPEKSLIGHGPYAVGAHLKKVAKLAKEWHFSDVKVFVSVRRQDNWIASAYSQGSNRWPNASQEHFEQYVSTLLDPSHDYYLNGISLDYNVLYSVLSDSLHDDNFLFLPYELMKDNLLSYIENIFSFMDIPGEGLTIKQTIKTQTDLKRHNVRSTKPDTWKIRKRSNLDAKVLRLRPGRLLTSLGLPTRLPLRRPEFGRGDEIHLTPELKAKIMSTYERSNRAFAEAIGMDLSVYGYCAS